MATAAEPGGFEINGVAHVILRVNRIAECIAFYDRLMPFLGLRAVQPRSAEFVYYVGGRTALAIRRADPEHADIAHEETGPGIDHLCFRARRREDVDALYPLLLEIGAEIVPPTTGRALGARLLLALLSRPGRHQARAQPCAWNGPARGGRHLPPEPRPSLVGPPRPEG